MEHESYSLKSLTGKRAAKSRRHASCFMFHASGFTLTELVIYVALLGIISGVIIHSVFTLHRAFALFRLERRISSNAEVVMRRMAREIHLANEVYASSTLGISPGVLSMAGKESEGDAAPKDAMFYVDAGALVFRKATSSAITLTGGGVTVTNMIFRRLINGETSEGVKVELSLRAVYGNASTTRNYYTTTVLRGSY